MAQQILFEMNDVGQHRLVVNGRQGRWAMYQSLSSIVVEGRTYVAGTEYGLLPEAEKAYELVPQPTTQMGGVAAKE